MSELAEKVSSRIAEHESTNVDKTKIMAIYKDESKNLKPAPVKSVETEKLREFSDRRQYARKKTDAKSKRLVRTVLIFTESSDQLSRATDRVPGLPASPGYVQ